MEELLLIDINSSNAATTWPLLLKAIDGADFVSVDLELSGLGPQTASKKSMEEHYQSLSAVVASRAILSFGMACFKWNQAGFGGTKPVSLTVQVFNVWLLIQQPFVTDPSSASFLLKHGFDFNKQYALGLSYTPPTARTKTRPNPAYPVASMLAHLLECGAPLVVHNGWLDLLFLYHSFYGPLPSTSSSLMADLLEMFPNGVYDTKGLAQFHFREAATHLEYVFRICQWRNSQSQESHRRYVVLESPFQDHIIGQHYVDSIPISFPPPLPVQQLLLVKVCSSFADDGYCHNLHCNRSHDVTLAIQQRELQAARRVRKKRSSSKRKMKSGTEMEAGREQEIEHDMHKGRMDNPQNGELFDITRGEPLISSMDGDGPPEKLGRLQGSSYIGPLDQEYGATSDPIAAFQEDFAAARARLSGHGSSRQPAHRAGYDAFMTGYAFACYAVASHGGKEVEGGQELAGLTDMRNKLASRHGNWQVPLQILKSQFTKTSATHKAAQRRLKELLCQQPLNKQV